MHVVQNLPVDTLFSALEMPHPKKRAKTLTNIQIYRTHRRLNQFQVIRDTSQKYNPAEKSQLLLVSSKLGNLILVNRDFYNYMKYRLTNFY